MPLPVRLSVLLLLGALAACGKADNAPGEGGVSVGEARALDEAAAKLDAQRKAGEAPPPAAAPGAPATPEAKPTSG